jgi:hypothetical protein
LHPAIFSVLVKFPVAKHCYHIDMAPIAEALKKEHPDKKEY